MNDKNWMLNPSAIRAARKCINITQIELGVSLKLSHPQFIEMLVEYADLTESNELQESLVELMTFYNQYHPEEAKKYQERKRTASSISIPVEESLKQYIREAGEPVAMDEIPVLQAVGAETPTSIDGRSNEMTVYNGKTYPMYNDAGKKFKGLYRGQPRYA